MMCKKTNNLIRAGAAAVLIFAVSCTHPLKVKNISSFRNMSMSSLNRRVTVGIVPTADDIHAKRLVKSIGQQLQKSSANVILPYYENSSTPADITARIAIMSDYKGSGWNFLINFPGFLVWAPAWNGYVYKVNFDVEVTLTRNADRQTIETFRVPVKLDVRHADINRTWTEISWLEVGAIALVGGIVFIQYDDNVSDILMDKVEGTIGDYIAGEIVARINSAGAGNPAAAVR